MKENVSSNTTVFQCSESVAIEWQLLTNGTRQMMMRLPRCLSPSAESEAGVVGAGPEGAGPQRTSVTLHLPRAAPGPAERPRHTSQNLLAPQEVRVALQGEEVHRASCSNFRICTRLCPTK